jgi:hypothetical protein
MIPNQDQTKQRGEKNFGRPRESNSGLLHPKQEFYHLTRAPLMVDFLKVSKINQLDYRNHFQYHGVLPCGSFCGHQSHYLLL